MKILIRKIWQNKIYRHLIYWLAVCLFLFVNVVIWDTAAFAIELVVILLLPAPIPVYLHFYIHRRFFERRKYLPYIVFLIIITIASGLFIEFVFAIITKDPESHISGIATAFFYIVITTAIKYSKNAITYQYRLQEAESKQLQTELALLKSQVNPHFFFNTLNNLYALSLDKSGRVPEVILELSNLMRYVLDSSRAKFVDLEDEYAFLKNYLALEKLRLSKKTSIQIKSHGILRGKQIAPMLFIPFVENSFKHGLNASTHQGYVHIDIAVDNNSINFSIENSKPKTPQATKNDTPQTGLNNVKRRLELLYPGRHTLSIRDNGDSYSIKLSLDL